MLRDSSAFSGFSVDDIQKAKAGVPHLASILISMEQVLHGLPEVPRERDGQGQRRQIAAGLGQRYALDTTIRANARRWSASRSGTSSRTRCRHGDGRPAHISR